jgi:organic radical activating enzyme
MSKCIVPWTQIEVCATGFCRPCAEYGSDLTWDDGSIIDFNDSRTTLDKVLKSHDYKRLRDQFRNGEKPEGCRKCWKLEDQGLKSRRQRELEAHAKHLDLIDSDQTKIVLFDIKLGNHCNLKCNICNSEYSKKWEQDELDWYGQVINRSYGKDWLDNPQHWKDIKAQCEHLEVLYLSGGEPFLTKQNDELLEHLINIDRAKDVWIKYHTNGTFRLTDRLINQFSKFKRIQLMYSIDDIGERFEYQRPPAKLNRVESNFTHALEHNFIDTKITYTVSLFNCLSGREVEKWCKGVGFAIENLEVNFLRDPIFYDLSMLDNNQKSQLLSLLDDGYIDSQVKKYIKSSHQPTFDETGWPVKTQKELDNLRKYVISKLDSKSKVSLMDVSPVIAKLVNANENMCLTT